MVFWNGFIKQIFVLKYSSQEELCIKNVNAIWFFGKHIDQTGFSRGCSTNTFITDLLIKLTFTSKPWKQNYTQTVRARKKKFWVFTPHHVSPVRCQVSDVIVTVTVTVRWQVSNVKYLFFYKVVGLFCGGSIINKCICKMWCLGVLSFHRYLSQIDVEQRPNRLEAYGGKQRGIFTIYIYIFFFKRLLQIYPRSNNFFFTSLSKSY